MRLVFGYDNAVAEWVGKNLGVTIYPPFTAIGGTHDGLTLCSGVVFNCYNGSNIDITMYGPHGLTRGAISIVYQYVFDQLKVNRLTALTRRSNKRMRQILPRLGFRYEGISARYFGPHRADDAVRFVLFERDARQRIEKYGQHTIAAAAA